jgi:histidinol-phosphate aminotransferase
VARFVPIRDDLGLSEGYHSPQVEAAVRLNTNESPLSPPAELVQAVQREVAQVAFHRYPDRGAWELRKAVAGLHGVEPEQVWCANGSNEVLQTLLLAFGGPGRRAAVFEPTYALHAHIARLTSTEVVAGGRAEDFSLDPDEVRRVLADGQPHITFVCSPNNPTGGAVDEATLRQILALAPGLVVVDEAYAQFAPWTALTLVAEELPLVVTRTYSKTWSMAGMRLGYAVGPASVIAAMERVALPYHLDSLKQVIGRLALRYTDDMERRVSMLVEERGRVSGALRQLAVDVWPSDANFVLFRPRAKAGHQVWEELLDRSVLIRDCSSWGGLPDCLRVTIGTPEENDAFLTALREVLRDGTGAAGGVVTP